MQIEKQIMTYDLHSYSQELQQAVLDGYRIVDQTIGFPQQIGSILCASLVKENKHATDKEIVSDVQDDVTPKPARKNAKKGAETVEKEV